MENINEIKKIISKLCIDDLSKITTFILGILDKKSKSTNSTHEIIDRIKFIIVKNVVQHI